MRWNRAGVFMAVVAALAAGSVAEAADDERWPPPGVSYHGDPKAPDLSGLWLGTHTGVPGLTPTPGRGSQDGRPQTYLTPWPLPYSPAYQKIYEERVAAAKKGEERGDVTAMCLPFGLPRALIGKRYPSEIVQTPGQVTIYIYGSYPVVVWTDGRAHPKDLAPSYGGHSIGYWVGDTLFVDTVGLEQKTPIDSPLYPHSAKLRVKWSIQPVTKDILHFHVTFHDEDAFTEPVTTTNIWHRKTDQRWEMLDDASCFENNKRIPTTNRTPSGFIKY